MLNLNAQYVSKTDFGALAAGVQIQEEGQVMVYVKEDGKTVLQPSAGVKGETFAGFALSRAIPPHWLPKVEEFFFDKNEPVYRCQRTPVAGKYLITINGVKATVETDGDKPAAAGHVDLVRDELRLADADHGKKVSIQYMYEPTVTEALEVTGDLPHGGLAGNKMGQCGLIVLGQIATSCFDAGVDWSNVMHPHMGPDGILTVGGNGELLTNVIVQNAPTTEQEFLVVKVKSV